MADFLKEAAKRNKTCAHSSLIFAGVQCGALIRRVS